MLAAVGAAAGLLALAFCGALGKLRGGLARLGAPVFAPVSYTHLVLAGVAAEVWWAVALVLVALVVVIMALGRMITGSALGRVPEGVKDVYKRQPVRARACCRTTTTWRSCGAAAR